MVENKIDVLFNKINLDIVTREKLKDLRLLKVKVNESSSSWTFIIESEDILDLEDYLKLVKLSKEAFNNINNIYFEITSKHKSFSKLKDYYLYLLDKLKDEILYVDIYKDRLDTYSLTIKVNNSEEEKQVSTFLPKINNFLKSVGFDLEIGTYLESDSLNRRKKEKEEKLEQEIKKMKVISYDTDDDNKSSKYPKRRKKVKDVKGNPLVAIGQEIVEMPIMIKDIIGEVDDVVVEGYVFSVEYFESTKNDYRIITLGITDYSDSIYCKIFCKGDDEYNERKKLIKEKTWYIFKGSVKKDKYSSNEEVLNIDSVNFSNKKEEKFIDDADVKRVELHAHTMMSQMDGITKLDLSKHTCELVEKCIEAGYSGVAITDHNGCQAFPISFNIIKNHNKKIRNGINDNISEVEEKINDCQDDHEKENLINELESLKKLRDNPPIFKGLYGTELTLVDDTVNVVIRPTDDNLIDTTYVVFDTETTGFNAGGADSMIEIGAVKIKNGEIISTFDELINPGRHIPDNISELTFITDDMVKDCGNEEEVTKRFLEWTGNLPMVAHNAKFDISFLTSAMNKYNLGEFENTVIDTLELSRILDQGFSRHSLSALVKRYDVEWDEESHHRADYDARGTALVFDKMLKKLEIQKYEKISDLEKLISKDEIHKFGRTYHFNAIAVNKKGLRNLFEIISLANTVYLYKTPRILRSKLNELRDGLLIGSGCYESEVFLEARSKENEELTNVIDFYDYVEVQPVEVYKHLIQTSDFKDEKEIEEHIKKIISTTKDAGKIIVATGDVHHFGRNDKKYREIIINQKVPGGGRHPLAKKEITEIPSQHFRNTKEMLDDFSFLGEKLAYEIVVENTNKVLDMVDEIEVIPDTKGIPFSPRVKADDGNSYLDCPRMVTDLVYEKAKDWYGDPLPFDIEERIATELYGDIVLKAIKHNLGKVDDKIIFKTLHDTVFKGGEDIKELAVNYIKETRDKEMSDKEFNEKIAKPLGGIIGAGFDPIYLIAQRLVKRSNDDGFLVGSRGSVGSSFVATMLGITEVNPLSPHYRCKECRISIFNDDNGNSLGATYSSGYDLPDKKCPKCSKLMYKDGQDMPFATFLGFNADKVPDIDLNFSELNQAKIHAYTKVLFGENNVYRAGTIGTVADKTAFGFTLGYFEDKIENIISEISKDLGKSEEELLSLDKKEKTNIKAKKLLLLQENIKSELSDDLLSRFDDMMHHVKEYMSIRSAQIKFLSLGCTGVKRTTGQHPGGIVVIPDYKEVYDFTPFQFPADDPTSPWRTTHFDYHSIEECVLKLDILGHSDPTQLKIIQQQSNTDIREVPLDDKDTMSIFTSPKILGVTEEQIMCRTGTLGIPEFGTPFTIGMVEETEPKSFGELIKISGLSHGEDVWVGNAQDLIKKKIVPFKEVIGCRDDIMVYLMYHGVKPIKAFKIMEFVRKGKASKEPDTWKEHVKVMKDANIPDWFIESCRKIKYMFPKAHAAAYVISAFRIAWYKVHMPVYYYSSWFSCKANDVLLRAMIDGYNSIKASILDIIEKKNDASNKEEDQLESLRIALEATARGIKFKNIDLYKSKATEWVAISDTEIIPPFSAIEGLGLTVANNIVEEREKSPFTTIEDFQTRCKVNKKIMDTIRSMGILDGLQESNQITLFDL